MPIYEYICLNCGTDFEKLVLKTDSPAVREVKCPVCGKAEVEEKISPCASFSKDSPSSTGGGCAPSGG